MQKAIKINEACAKKARSKKMKPSKRIKCSQSTKFILSSSNTKGR